MMKAIVWTRIGPPEGLMLKAVAKPVPGDNEVLIRVRATSVFAGDAEIRGLRIALAYRLPIWIYKTFVRSRDFILGQELAGEIEAVGPAVTRFKPGDQVYAATGFGMGAYAQYKVMPETGSTGLGGALARKPQNLSFAEAAAVPVGGLEALYFIRQARLQPGERLAINGAGGSIGTMVLQLARLAGAEVAAVDSADKLDLLRALGAAEVFDYRREDFTRGRRYDVILDVVGKSRYGRCLAALNPNGRYLLSNATQLARWRARWAPNGKQVIHGTGPQRATDLDYLTGLIEAGQLKPAIDRSYPLEQMAAAHRYVDGGRKRGNVVITVD